MLLIFVDMKIYVVVEYLSMRTRANEILKITGGIIVMMFLTEGKKIQTFFMAVVFPIYMAQWRFLFSMVYFLFLILTGNKKSYSFYCLYFCKNLVAFKIY